MADILTFGVKMRSWHKNIVRIGIFVVKLLLKEVSHKFLGGLVQKLDFPQFRRRPFWKRVNIWKCSRDMTWHPPESWRAIPRLQETVEKKTLSSKTRFTSLDPGLSVMSTLINISRNIETNQSDPGPFTATLSPIQLILVILLYINMHSLLQIVKSYHIKNVQLLPNEASDIISISCDFNINSANLLHVYKSIVFMNLSPFAHGLLVLSRIIFHYWPGVSVKWNVQL